MLCVICQIYLNITLQYIYTVSLIINGKCRPVSPDVQYHLNISKSIFKAEQWITKAELCRHQTGMKTCNEAGDTSVMQNHGSFEQSWRVLSSFCPLVLIFTWSSACFCLDLTQWNRLGLDWSQTFWTDVLTAPADDSNDTRHASIISF